MIKLTPGRIQTMGLWANPDGTPTNIALGAYLVTINSQLNSLADDITTISTSMNNMNNILHQIKSELDQVKSSSVRPAGVSSAPFRPLLR